MADSETAAQSETNVDLEVKFMDDLNSYANKAVADMVPGMDSLGKMLQGTA